MQGTHQYNNSKNSGFILLGGGDEQMDDWNDGGGGLLARHGVAQAQSSVQVYGLLSAGIGYVSDEGKCAAARMR